MPDVKLWSRAGRNWHGAFPRIVKAIADLPVTSLMLDGEAVMLREDGTSDFFALRASRAHSDARLIAFDLLEVDGQDMRPSPLEERRDRLAGLLREEPSLSLLFSEAVEGDQGAALYRHACAMNLEGIISKRKGSLYRSGPTSLWRKIRCPGYTRTEEGEPQRFSLIHHELNAPELARSCSSFEDAPMTALLKVLCSSGSASVDRRHCDVR